MAKIWFCCEKPQGVPTPDAIFNMTRMNRALELAEKKGWDHDIEDMRDTVDFSICVPDEQVNGVLGDILNHGITPGTIDFDEFTGVEAEKAVTSIFEYTEAELPD